MLFTIKWLSAIFTSHQGTIHDEAINHVSIDSRKQLEQSLFVPIIGEQYDSHTFAEQALHNGAIAFLWDEGRPVPDEIPDHIPIFLVKDTVAALQKLAHSYREEISPTVIGITGSNGKTTTKDMVASVLKTTYKTHYTDGNFNNHIGLPLTILSMPRETEMLVLEMGMNDFKEISRLSFIAQPDIAIITNIGESHIEFLGTREGIATAKLEIIDGLTEGGLIIIDGDESLLHELQGQKNITTCGYVEDNDCVITDVKIAQDKTTFSLSNGVTYTIPLLGKHHAQNASYAISLGKSLNIDTEKIKSGLLNLELTSMRFELIKGQNDVTVINDAYNASPSSMKAAIEVVKQMDGFKEKVLVLGDIFELGDHVDELHQSIGKIIERPITAVYTYGDKSQFISSAVKQPSIIKCKHFDSKEKLLTELQPYLNKHSLLLFKASRGMFFEKLVEKVV